MTRGLADTSIFVAQERERPLGPLDEDDAAMAAAHPALAVLRV